MTGRLEGRSALVTGAAGGIGAAVAELFVAEGAAALLFDNDAAGLERAGSRIRADWPAARIATHVGDIANADDAEQGVRRAVAAFGGLCVVVNNAAIRHYVTVAESTPQDWQQLLSVNLLGAVNVSRAALAPLRESGHGAIVTVSSGFAIVGRDGASIYDASKAALLALTRSLAHEEAAHGIRANAVCAGSTLTPFAIRRGLQRGLSEDETRHEARTDSLLARWATCMEIAYPILWLASDEASYMTGSSVVVDGGMTIM